MRRPRILPLVLGAVLAAGAVSALRSAARAADAPASPGPATAAMQPKVDHPFVASLLGDWDVTATGPMGESKARSSLRLTLGDTAVAHDWAGDAFGAPFFGHGIYRVTADGKGIVCWWFDSHTADPLKMIGPLTETSAELSGSGAGGPLTITWKKVDDGLEWTMASSGTTIMKQAYRKPAK